MTSSASSSRRHSAETAPPPVNQIFRNVGHRRPFTNCARSFGGAGANADGASSNYPVFKGLATLYVLKMTPDVVACVLTSSNARAGVPSAKKRFPVPNNTG